MKQIYLFLLLIFSVTSIQAQKNLLNLIVGTYTNSCSSRGIYVYEFNTQKAQIRLKKSSDSISSPSYVSLSKDGKYMYAVNENGNESTVSSFSFDPVSGKPSSINKVDSKGADPCYLINDDSNVIVANYSGGNIAVFGKNADGSLTEAKQVVQHYGKGANPERQEKAHVHMVYFSPDKKYVLSTDLGTDKIYVYNYNPTATTDVLTLKDSVSVTAGSGPRHLKFSKNGKFVYLLQELDGSITSFSYLDGKLSKVFETSILAKDFKGTFSAADIEISPNGKFLYASNRGEANNISVFKILKKGKLAFKGQTSTLGKGPRSFVIDPTGKFLLVGHQYTNNIVIFKIHKRKGTLTDSGKSFDLCSPVCLIFGEGSEVKK
ncbi:lactonase family protein [Flavobacterium sp. WC2509]|uniref:lactonase family protein n=1 Tax=Flavobacterium sp. WC2509 TaxID=3461406 RepID=UPI004044A737